MTNKLITSYSQTWQHNIKYDLQWLVNACYQYIGTKPSVKETVTKGQLKDLKELQANKDQIKVDQLKSSIKEWNEKD